MNRSPSFVDEPSLSQRLASATAEFRRIYQEAPQLTVRSPGRAEILGNHTDYNQGYALAAAISRSTLALMSKRSDGTIHIASNAFPGAPVCFPINRIERDEQTTWTNYARGVAAELLGAGYAIGGANILIDSNVPSSGGVSSSAAFELAIAVGMSQLYGIKLDLLQAALLSKRAENGPLVGTPCGLLDQASVAFSKSDAMVLLDFQEQPGKPLGVELIPAHLSSSGLSFVISVDPEVKRNLGATGYPARRKMCEDSVPILSRLLGRELKSLREVSVSEFEKTRTALETQGSEIMRMRVEHIVHENQRVLDGVEALRRGDTRIFGELLNKAGHSALELYGLDEKTPELTFLVDVTRSSSVAMGSRNMGGGFSAITLSLMKRTEVSRFCEEVGGLYSAKWGRKLLFIDFQMTEGVEVLAPE